jgi:hypothetical protein
VDGERSPQKHHEGNPRFMGQGFKEITLWDKTLTVTFGMEVV